MNKDRIQVERLFTEFDKNPDGDWNVKGLSIDTSFIVQWQQSDKAVTFGRFTLAPMPGCCGVVVSTGSYIEPYQRGQYNPSRWFHSLKAETARHFGYTTMIMTTQLRNIPEVVGASHCGWKFHEFFRNKRTGHDIGIAIKVLS